MSLLSLTRKCNPTEHFDGIHPLGTYVFDPPVSNTDEIAMNLIRVVGCVEMMKTIEKNKKTNKPKEK